MGILTRIASYTPVVGQAMGFASTAVKDSNATSPQTPIAVAIEGIIQDCTPPQIKYPFKCAMLLGQVGIAIASSTNPVTGPMALSLLIGQCTSILEENLV